MQMNLPTSIHASKHALRQLGGKHPEHRSEMLVPAFATGRTHKACKIDPGVLAWFLGLRIPRYVISEFSPEKCEGDVALPPPGSGSWVQDADRASTAWKDCCRI